MYVVHIHLVEFERPFERITQDSITWNWKAQICIIYSWTRGKCFKKGFEKTFKSSQPCRNDLCTKAIQIFFCKVKKKWMTINLPRYFSFFLRATILSRPLKAPEPTNKIFVVSTSTVFSFLLFRLFFSGHLTMVPSTIFNIPCWTPSPPTSRSWWIPGTAPILSSSSRKIIPCSAFATS